jgi:cell division protein FtsB
MYSKYELATRETLIGEIEKKEAERDALQARIKQLEAELEEERQENASLRSGDDYERGAE